MKLLVVTNLYPPHHVGGYELGCRDVVEKLRARGHLVRVLTGNFRNNEDRLNEPDVERILYCRIDADSPAHQKWSECAKLVDAMNVFSPDVVYFWNQDRLCRWLPLAAYWRGVKVAFFLSDTSFISWRVGAWLARPAQSKGIVSSMLRAIFGKTCLVTGWPVIQNQACHFASEFLRHVALQNGITCTPHASTVAHWGIEPAQFPATQRERWPVRRLLYVGQMIPQKGVHTALAAFSQLARENDFVDITFSLAGGGMRPDYENQLRAQVTQQGLEGRVHFLGRVQREDLSRIYAEHDVLVFPSEWDEPFAITPLEAMASGMAVVGTTTGGSGELFRNRDTAITFRAGDAEDCAAAIRKLCSERELFRAICRQGQYEVGKKYTLNAMVDIIEKSLRII